MTLDSTVRPDWRGGLAVALLVTAVLAVAGQQLRPLMSVDEPRYMAVAWEMWRDGTWLVPHLNGSVYPDKPPLLFWAIHLAWSVFGVSEAAARSVPTVFALLAVGLTAYLARRLWPERRDTSDVAALILAGIGLFATLSSLVMFDALLTVCVLIGVIGLDTARRGHGLRGWALFGIGAGLGVLSKGPVVLVHLLPAAALAPIWLREARPMSWGRWYLGCAGALVLGTAIALAWAIPAAVAGGPAYRDAIFWGQSASRVIGSSEHSHAQPLWFYLAVLPALLFPWLYWPPLWSAARRIRDAFDDPLRMVLLWAACAFVILSAFGGKQSHYLMPEMPALALLGARLLHANREAGRSGRWLPVAACLGIAAALVGVGFWSRSGHPLPRVLAVLPLWSGLAFLALAGLFALAGRRLAAGPVVALLCPAVVLLGEYAAKDALDAYGLGEIARRAQPFEATGIGFVGEYHGELTFPGRLEQPVTSLPDTTAVAAWIQDHPGGVLVGVPDANSEARGLPELYRKPYRSKTVALWQVPG